MRLPFARTILDLFYVYFYHYFSLFFHFDKKYPISQRAGKDPGQWIMDSALCVFTVSCHRRLRRRSGAQCDFSGKVR